MQKNVWQNEASSFHCWFWWDMDLTDKYDEAVKVARRDFELDINYFDRAILDEDGVEKCTKCGECEPKCLYRIPIITMLLNTQIDLQR